jgi:hypothetical protein
MSVRIPVYGRVGVVAHALVDDDDAELVSAYRWGNLVNGYISCGVPHPSGGQRTIYLHRLVLGLDFGDRREGDHKNLDKLDNRRENLRVASRSQNAQNVPSQGGTSRYRGVAWHKAHKRWRAYVFLDGRQAFHGYFESELDAARAAARFRAEHMPFSVEDPALLEAAA